MPPTNHLANGGFHSKTCDHFWNQWISCSASSPQNSSGCSAGASVERAIGVHAGHVGFGDELGARWVYGFLAHGKVRFYRSRGVRLEEADAQ